MTVSPQIKPMQLQVWANFYQPAEDLIYGKDYWDQIIFVRDQLASILAPTYEEYWMFRESGLTVISLHISWGVHLPVYNIKLTDGTEFTMRCNFSDWKVSVHSPRDVEADFMGLFDPALEISLGNCEGFPANMVYGPYAENKRKFTIELPSGNYHIFTFFWIFAHQVLGNRNKPG